MSRLLGTGERIPGTSPTRCSARPRQVHPGGPRAACQHPQQRLRRASRPARALPGARRGAAQHLSPAPGRPPDQPRLSSRNQVAAPCQEVSAARAHVWAGQHPHLGGCCKFSSGFLGRWGACSGLGCRRAPCKGGHMQGSLKSLITYLPFPIK